MYKSTPSPSPKKSHAAVVEVAEGFSVLSLTYDDVFSLAFSVN